MHETGGRFHWSTDAYPANHVSLRSIGWDNTVIIDVVTGRALGELDWRATPTMLHEQAIYQHDGEQYQVEKLDYENHKAFVRGVAPDYYTTAQTHTRVSVLEQDDQASVRLTPEVQLAAGLGDAVGRVSTERTSVGASVCSGKAPAAAAGAGAVPASMETYHTLRIEAGRPYYGIDIDENRFVMEVGGAERAVSYSKGCYLGQEPIVMARDRAGHAPRSFVQLKFPKGSDIPANAKLFLGTDEIGLVTSACQSPRWHATLALGYVRWKHREPGTVVEAETADGRVVGEVLRV